MISRGATAAQRDEDAKRGVKSEKFGSLFKFNFIAPKERDFLEKSYDFSRRHSDTAVFSPAKE